MMDLSINMNLKQILTSVRKGSYQLRICMLLAVVVDLFYFISLIKGIVDSWICWFAVCILTFPGFPKRHT